MVHTALDIVKYSKSPKPRCVVVKAYCTLARLFQHKCIAHVWLVIQTHGVIIIEPPHVVGAVVTKTEETES